MRDFHSIEVRHRSTAWARSLAQPPALPALHSHRKGDIMNRKTGWAFAVSTLAICALLTLAACSKKENTEQSNNAPTESAAPAATPIDPATVATIKGTVKFD